MSNHHAALGPAPVSIDPAAFGRDTPLRRIGDTWDVLPIDENLTASLLASGSSEFVGHMKDIFRVARSVATIDFSPIGTSGRATGYLSEGATVTTAAHVLRDDSGREMPPDLFRQLAVRFFVRDTEGRVTDRIRCRPTPGSLRFDATADVARFEVTVEAGGPLPPPLSGGSIALHERAALVMNGGLIPQFVSTRFGLVRERDNALRVIRYDCDTERGASGSPVFNARWEVVATHTRVRDELAPLLNEGVLGDATPTSQQREERP